MELIKDVVTATKTGCEWARVFCWYRLTWVVLV